MTSQDDRTHVAADLRQKAEALARQRAERAPQDSAALSPEEIRKTLHELRVHQIELEMQNEELRTAQAEIEAGWARYFDLYDLAPVGYSTLSEQGLILEANLTAATLLGTARGALIKRPISCFILKDDQDIYYLHRKKLFETGEPQECELRLAKPDGPLIWAHLTATAAQADDGAPVCRVAISDISERKRAEEQRDAAFQQLRAANQQLEASNQQLRATQAREAHLKQVLLAIRNVDQLIVQEDDPQRLIARACENLTGTLGYFNAWIKLLDGEGGFDGMTACAGFNGRLERMGECLASDEFPACMRQALAQDATIVVSDPPSGCTDCPLAFEYGGRAGFTRRLAFEDKIYGILAVSVPAEYAGNAEEQGLFDEVAGDLGFALHKIEMGARLRGAETCVRAKLNAVLSPEGDLGALTLADVLDVPAIQKMMDDFYGLTGMGMAILDLQNRILVATGWQDICTKFHRIHPETRRHCIESDTVLSSGVEPGSFKVYRCKNNLWDFATPIMLGSRHAGNLFLGQFFFEGEEADPEVFRRQALRYGFDEASYLAALDRLPRWSRERVTQAMTFFTAFAQQISDLSYGNVKLARSLAQRDELLDRLGHNEERLRLALKATNDVVWDWDIVNNTQRWNASGTAVFGWTDIVEAPQTVAWWVDRVHPEDRQRVEEKFFAAVQDPAADRWDDEYRFRRADGAFACVVDRGHLLRDADGRAVRMIGAMLDISGRKRMEESLRESETRFRFIVDHSYDLIWTLKSDGVFFYVSPSWKTGLGYEPSFMVGKAFQPFVHPDDVAACEAYMSRVLDARSALPGPQYRVRHADASWRWHEAVMTPTYAEDGSFMYFVGVSRDITERRHAELALSRSKALLNASQRLAQIGGWEWNLSEQTMTWTDETYRIHDLESGDIAEGSDAHIAKSLQCYEEHDRPTVLAAFRKCVEQGSPYDMDLPLTTFKGRRLWIRTSAHAVLEDGKVRRVVGMIMDITERKRVEQALRESEEQFRAANDASLDALMLLRSERDETGEIRDFVFVDVNRRTEEMLRMGRDQLLGKRLCQALPINREAGFFEKYKRVVDTGVPLEEEFFLPETHVPAAWYYHQVVKVHDGIFIYQSDIGDRKRAEVERENLQAQLRQAQKMEAVGRLAGGVAHDFNNMLGIILGHADMILAQMDPDQPLYADLTEIRKAGARSADLTRQLLAFARKQTVAPKVIDLNKTVAGMTRMLLRLIGEDIDMAWIPDEKVWPVKIDPGQIDQILANLCVNARDAIPGVGKVTIETGNTVFDEDYCMDHAEFVPGEYAMLAVSDNGCGMDSETISHLFEPFFTTKELGKGTGLGLATVYGVVKQNNGLINVYSESGQGTTIKIYLPRHLAKAVPLPAKGPDKPSERCQETVLLVEDEPAILKMTTRMLEREGYTVVAAGTPGEAIRLANEHHGNIHLLMSDVVMPEMNGRDLAKNILSLYPHLKCLFMSGYTADVIAHHGVLDEGVNFIQKPFSMGELTVKVRNVIGDVVD
jgi:PAS domain S-box-containing protein